MTGWIILAVVVLIFACTMLGLVGLVHDALTRPRDDTDLACDAIDLDLDSRTEDARRVRRRIQGGTG